MFRRILVLLALVVAYPASSQPNTIQAPIELDGLEDELRVLAERYQTPGLAVAVIRDGQIIFVDSIGLRDVENGKPVTKRTLFGIGSIVKSFTSGLLGSLTADGLALDARPSDYLPELVPASSAVDERATLHHLLSQTSGLPSLDASLSFFQPDTRRQLLRQLTHFDSPDQAGAPWHYNNLNFVVLDAVSEAATGKTKRDLIASRLLEPAGMVDTVASTAEFRRSVNAAVGYGMVSGQPVRVATERMFGEQVYASAPDLARWIGLWMSGGRIADSQIIPADYVAKAISMQAIDNGSAPSSQEPGVYLFGYGYGWFVKSVEGNYVVHHGGNENGFSSHALFVPGQGFGVVALTNQQNSILPNIVTDMVLRRLAGLEKVSAQDYPVQVGSVAALLATEETCLSQDASAAIGTVSANLAGTYRAAGYGDIRVASNSCGLSFATPAGKMALLHREGRTFGLGLTERIPVGINAGYFEVTFDEGELPESLSVNLASVPVRFSRVQDSG